MNKLVNLVNVFALLSLLAVGGGTAVLPQMKHDVVVTHRWLSAEQFTDIYSLGQLSPGPNMNMVTVIGYHVSGIAGRDPGTARLLSAVVHAGIRGRQVLGPL